MERWEHDRRARSGRRQNDRRPPTGDNRRILLVGADEGWRLLTAYVLEEAGYSVFAAGDPCQALASATQLLPDVVLVQLEASDTLDLLAGLSAASSTFDIPVAILTTLIEVADAQRARAAGGVTLLDHSEDVDMMVREVDALIGAEPRARRTLKRRLRDLQALARYYAPTADGQARLRHMIDRLQVAILAIDEEGHCVAASQGATILTGYSHLQLVTASVFHAGFAGAHLSEERWRAFLASRQYAGTTTITNRAGEDLTVHAAAVAEVLPGLHVAAFAAA